MPGVCSTKVGYSGGSTQNPTYRSIGDHTETVQIHYRPSKISYEELLNIFWNNHNPTFKRSKKQYQCFVFTHNDAQFTAALSSLEQLQNSQQGQIHTKIEPFTTFTDAEGYHQKYMLCNDTIIMDLLGLDKDSEDFKSSFIACKVNGYLGRYGSFNDFLVDLEAFGLGESTAETLKKKVQRNMGLL